MKKQLISEVKRMQELAGIKTLNENEDTVQVAQKVNQILPKVEDQLEDILNKMTPEQKEQIQQELSKLGITDTSTPEQVLNKIEDKVSDIISEEEQVADQKTVKEKIGDLLHQIGAGNLSAWGGVPAALVAGGAMGSMPLGFAVSLGGTALLMGLAKLLGSKEGND